MQLLERTVELTQTSREEAKEAVEQMLLAFSLYDMPEEAQNATWDSAKKFITYLLLTEGKIPENVQDFDAHPLQPR